MICSLALSLWVPFEHKYEVIRKYIHVGMHSLESAHASVLSPSVSLRFYPSLQQCQEADTKGAKSLKTTARAGAREVRE